MTRRVLLAALLSFAATLALAAPEDAPTADPRPVVGEPRGPRLSGAELEQRTAEVGALLRCPVCQGLSVSDSPATMAQNMKRRVRELLAEGYDQEQVLAYFEGSYGEFVRLQPPLRGVNWLVWAGPAVGLLAGVVIVAFALRRPGRAAVAGPAGTAAPARDALPDDPALAAAVRRIRERAYGWPDGVPADRP